MLLCSQHRLRAAHAPLIDDPPELTSMTPQAADAMEFHPQLVQLKFAIAPEIWKTVAKVGVNAGFDGALTPWVVNLDVQLDQIARTSVADHDLPVVADP